MDNDECYQALSCIHYQNSPLAILTFYIGNIWITLFKDNLFSLRCLCVLCYLVSIGIGTLYLYRKTSNIKLTTITFLICCLIANIGGFRIYNWDTGCYPVNSLFILLMLIYISKPSLKFSIYIGITIGIMTMSRIPLISTFLIYLTTTWFILKSENDSSKTYFKYTFSSFGAICITILITSTLIAGSPLSFISSFKSENIITGHGISNAGRSIWIFKELFPRVLINWMPIIVSLVVAIFLLKAKYKKNRFASILCFPCILTGWSMVKIHGQLALYADPIFTIGLPFGLICSLHPLFYNRYINNYHFSNKTVISSVIVGIFPFFMALGSDTPFERWNYSYIIPFVIAIIWNQLHRNGKIIIKYWLSYSLCTLIVVFISMLWHTQKEAKPLDFQLPYHERICMRKSDSDMFYMIQHDISNFDKDESYSFWGSNRYMFEYTFGRNNIFPLHKFHIKDTPEIELIQNLNKIDYLFIVTNPDNPNSKQTNLLRYLSARSDFEIIKDTENYTLFRIIPQVQK